MGTGHNSITHSPDGKEMFIVYHGRTTRTGDERVVFIDRMEVKDGEIKVYGPTTTPQKLPWGVRTFTNKKHCFLKLFYHPLHIIFIRKHRDNFVHI